ncbi:hypothetical protein AHAS_Ahas15G0175700 [Arachis hypogaea]
MTSSCTRSTTRRMSFCWLPETPPARTLAYSVSTKTTPKSSSTRFSRSNLACVTVPKLFPLRPTRFPNFFIAFSFFMFCLFQIPLLPIFCRI